MNELKERVAIQEKLKQKNEYISNKKRKEKYNLVHPPPLHQYNKYKNKRNILCNN